MNGFARLPALLAGARHSRLRLWLLNLFLGRLVPFNKSHGVRVLALGEDVVQTTAPYRRSNYNHLGGVHACCIATVAEFSSGLLLLSKLDPNRYRLIMAKLEIDYHRQAKSAILATTQLSNAELLQRLLEPLAGCDKVQTSLVTEIHDEDGKQLATALVTWQVKAWEKVQTTLG